MRPIDADKVKEYVLTEGFYCDTRADKEYTAELIDQLFPTIKAIPIEWLYQKRTLYLENKCYMSLMVINEILNWWEKENE